MSTFHSYATNESSPNQFHSVKIEIKKNSDSKYFIVVEVATTGNPNDITWYIHFWAKRTESNRFSLRSKPFKESDLGDLTVNGAPSKEVPFNVWTMAKNEANKWLEQQVMIVKAAIKEWNWALDCFKVQYAVDFPAIPHSETETTIQQMTNIIEDLEIIEKSECPLKYLKLFQENKMWVTFILNQDVSVPWGSLEHTIIQTVSTRVMLSFNTRLGVVSTSEKENNLQRFLASLREFKWVCVDQRKTI